MPEQRHYDARRLERQELLDVLKRCGSRTMTPEQLDADLEAGAPQNEDGTIDIIAYAAWILKGNLNGD